MIDTILPPEASWAEAFDDDADVALFPEEEAQLTRAVDKRRREYTTARHCARQALAGLGLAPAPVVSGDKGAPQWPEGIVGSITHTQGYRAAAVARVTDLAALGIDAEPHDALPDGVLSLVVRGDEVAHLKALAADHPEVHWDRLLFCAKEATYKAWFPLAHRWLGFEDAEVTLVPDPASATVPAAPPAPGPDGAPVEAGSGTVVRTGTFVSRLLVPGPRPTPTSKPIRRFTGRYLATPALVATAITLPT
jgi:4'-phosphopantetheinyl transferase EntD